MFAGHELHLMVVKGLKLSYTIADQIKSRGKKKAIHNLKPDSLKKEDTRYKETV